MTKITLVSNVKEISITNPQLNDTLIYSGGIWYNRPVPSSSGVGGGHTIEDEGIPLTQRTKLNFVGAGVTVTDNAGTDTTTVTISGAVASGTVDWTSITNKPTTFPPTAHDHPVLSGVMFSGVTQTLERYINFKGDVAVTDNATLGATDVYILSGYRIADEGNVLPKRSKLNFVGTDVTVTDSAGTDTTTVTISGGGSQTLSGLLDVNITGVNDFDFLHFNSASAKWEDFPSQFKPTVYLASTTNITLSGTYTLQDLPIDPGDRILAAGQLATTNNGIYIASEGAWQRAPDSDTWDKISEMYVWSYTGTWARTWWLCENDRVGTLGVTPISYIRIGRQNPGDMLKATYDSDNDGIVDQAAAVPWAGITDKPNVISGIQLNGTNQTQEPKLNFVSAGGITITMADDNPNTRTTITISGSSASGIGDMLKSVYDTNNDGIVNAASSVPWTGITGKPNIVITGIQAVSAFDVYYDMSDRGILRFQDGLFTAHASDPNITVVSNRQPGHVIYYSGAPTVVYPKFNVMGQAFLGGWPDLSDMQTLYIPSGINGVYYSGIAQPYEQVIDFTGNLTVVDVPSQHKLTVTVPTTISWDNITGKPLFDVYFRDLASTVSGYAQLVTTVPTGTENDDSVAVVVGDGEKLIEAYIMDNLGPTKIDAGTWQFNFWASVSSTAGTSQLVFRVYKRTSGGSETEFFNVASDAISSTSVLAMNILTTQNDCVLGTDKLVVKVFAKTSSASSKTIHFYHDGATHNSHFHTAGFATTEVGHILQDEGIDLPARTKINFVGSGVSAVDDPTNDATIITISGGSSGGGHTILDEGIALAQRTNLNFVGNGVTVTDDSGNNRTVVSIPVHSIFTLDDTFISSPQPGDILQLDANGIYWQNVAFPGLSGVLYSGIAKPFEPILNFTGNVTVTDDAVNHRTIIAVQGTSAGGGHTIQSGTVSMPQRTNLSFSGISPITVLVSDSSANDRTSVTVSGNFTWIVERSWFGV